MESFQLRQQQLSRAIRNPDIDSPEGIEARRLKIYQDLFFNNFYDFLSQAFPVCRRVLGDSQWRSLVRQFMRDHPCRSPYFLSIAETFLEFLDQSQAHLSVPDFFNELAHYEWVELALDVSDAEFETEKPELHEKAIFDANLILSPLAYSLAYRFPVQQIGADFQPEMPPAEATFLVVYRNRDEQVKFMAINQFTALLLREFEVREFEPAQERTAGQLLEDFCDRHGQSWSAISSFALDLLHQLYRNDILLLDRQR
ncbi:putative DNA-binding domain-containing protein [Spongiibacter sp. KMU-158]|uniref:DNA-binding domain-containing protein n=1 Tax=Spongiibacter pelagi TaxID=2760804 RepID=A0A927GVB6_9GAMM|nr:putative DNA-binding domain-containing protein [Spongiibacter pelagi]MBD2858496.1 putative DNA-binding domain-containing protein [Spongiibacter pelagi]